MIDAGCELVRQRGLAFDPPSLTYAKVFDHLEQTKGIRLHRSQVHERIWANQEAYRIEVVVSTIRDSMAGSEEIDQLVEEMDRPDGLTSARRLAEQWVASSVEISIEQADADRRVDLFVAAQALSTSGSATAPDIGEAARANLEERMDHNEERFRVLASRLGVDPDPTTGLDPDDAFALLARNSSALIEGGRLLATVDGELDRPFETVDADGAPVIRTGTTLGLSLLLEEVLGLRSTDVEPAAVNRATDPPDEAPGRTPTR